MNNKEKLTKAKYAEWQASLFGACVIAFGLGVLLSEWFGSIAPVLILIGIVLHAWGMYKMNQRNEKKD